MNVKYKSGSYKGIPRGGVCYPATHVLPMVTFLDCVETLQRITRKPCGRGSNLPGTLWKWYAVRTLQTQWVSKLKPSNRIFAALLFLALGILANPAYAITCTVTTTSVNFGNYTTTTATPNDSVGTVTTKCSNNGQTSIATDISLSTGFGTYAQRKMKSGSNLLNYNLYTNASRATVWTNVVPPEGHANYQVNTTPIDKIFSVFGRIPALQNVPIGTYTDTITVTVNY
jgi:spore coat protein U-like protein